VQRFRALAARRDADWILLDGEHLLAEALQAGVRIDTVLSDGRSATVTARARDAGALLFEGTSAVLEAASPVRSASGVVAIAEWQALPAYALLARPDTLAVGLVGMQDPGNVGGVIRCADALGATAVLVLGQSADPAGWKALRGAMGSTFRVPVGIGEFAEVLPHARRLGVRLAATVPRGGAPLDASTLARPLLLLFGNEGAGLDPAVIDEADVRVSVPMRPGVESLNVAAAAAVLIWEAARARPASALP
jgi:RNA methyltransferase, TrmH family